MLKKITLALMLIIPMGVFAQKFAHVSTQEIVLAMPEYNKVMDELQTLNQKLSDEMQAMNNEFQKKWQEYQQALADGVPENITERRQKDLEGMLQTQEQFQQEAYQTMEKKQAELMAPVYAKMEEAVKAVGAEEGYVYVFDISRTYIPFVNETLSIDVTNKVRTKLGIK